MLDAGKNVQEKPSTRGGFPDSFLGANDGASEI